MNARQNRPRTESPGHNRPNNVGDYVRFLHQRFIMCMATNVINWRVTLVIYVLLWIYFTIWYIQNLNLTTTMIKWIKVNKESKCRNKEC